MIGLLETRKIVLREDRNEDGYYYLAIRYSENGDLLIEGQDLGPRAKEVFDCIEYQWLWTIKRENLELLKSRLSLPGGLLKSLKRLFAEENATNLYEFLCENDIPFEKWSRTGD